MKPITASGPGLLICVPTLGRPVSLDWAFAWKGLNPPLNYRTEYLRINGKPIDEARNMAAQAAIDMGAKYLYFVGDDTINPSHALKQFIFRMENDPMVGVVGGVYVSKSNPPAPLVFRGNGNGSYWDWKIGEYFECTGLGMDATFIRVELLERLKLDDPLKPLFRTVDEDKFLDGLNSATQWTEDLYFLDRVKKETSFRIMCDASVLCDHVDTSVIPHKVYSVPNGSLPTRQMLVPKGAKKIIDIGCGHVVKEFPEGPCTRVDIDETCNPDYRADVANLPFDNEEFDIAYSSHVLEHFAKGRVNELVREWTRILKIGGELRLVLPNIAWAARQLTEDPNAHANVHVMNVLYGGQYNLLDYHSNGFTPKAVKELLEMHGYLVHEPIVEEHYNMFINATKLDMSVEA